MFIRTSSPTDSHQWTGAGTNTTDTQSNIRSRGACSCCLYLFCLFLISSSFRLCSKSSNPVTDTFSDTFFLSLSLSLSLSSLPPSLPLSLYLSISIHRHPIITSEEAIFLRLILNDVLMSLRNSNVLLIWLEWEKCSSSRHLKFQ